MTSADSTAILMMVRNIMDIEEGSDYIDHTLGEQPVTYKISPRWKLHRIIDLVDLARRTCKDNPRNPRVRHCWNKAEDGWKCQWCNMEAK